MFGDELKKARERAGLTQEQLAFKAGLNPAYVNRLEKNRHEPSLGAFLHLAKALGIPGHELLIPIERVFERYGHIVPKHTSRSSKKPASR